MEQGPNIIDFAKKKREKEAKIDNGEHYEAGEFYEFKKPMPVFFLPKRDEKSEEAEFDGFLTPGDLLPGKYKCLGFDEETKAYIFRGKPAGEEEEADLFISPEDIH